MSAIIQIQELTSSTSGIDKTSSTVRFKSVDITTVDTSNAITIPTTGINYSFTKQLQFYFVNGPATNIQNLRAYSDGTNFATGVNVNYDTTNSFGTNFNTNLGGSSFVAKTSSSPIALDTTNTGPFTGTGLRGDILRLQMNVGTTASSGLINPRTASFSYDES